MEAVSPHLADQSDFELADELSRISGISIPPAIAEIRTADIRHKMECDIAQMPDVVRGFLV